MSPLAINKILWIKPGQSIAAQGTIPSDSEFFQDHFPAFPVLPGVLALEMLKQTAEAYLNSTQHEGGDQYFLKEIHATKFSAYLRPGDEWESRLELVSDSGNETRWNGQLLHNGKPAVSAQLILAPSHKAQAVLVKE